MSCIESVWAQAHSLRRKGYTGKGVDVGQLDTGVDRAHPALRHQPRSFCHFDRNGFCRPSVEPFDSNEHGTGVASVICGVAANGECIGIAPECHLHGALVLEDGDVVSRILFGMEWMARQRVRVLCAPLGIPGPTPIFHGMVRALAQGDALVVAPIGNGGAGRSLSPGDYEEVLSVGAIDADGAVASFSGSYHRGAQVGSEKPDVLAPGDNVRVAKPGGGFRPMGGTSIACAFVAGVAASLRQAAPRAPAASIKAAIVETSLPLPEDKRHRCRSGVIQPEAALQRVLSGEKARDMSFSQPGDAGGHGEGPSAAPKYVDPRLQEALRYSTHDALVEGIFVAAAEEKWRTPDPRGAAGRLVDAVSGLLGEQPKRTRYVPIADVVLVLATAPYLRRLVDRPDVLVASAVDTTQCPFGP